jgi:hypothetical protein
MDEGDEEIQLGQLHAGHIGRVIAIGREDRFPYLVGMLVRVRHRFPSAPRARPDERYVQIHPEPSEDKLTEVTIVWHRGQDVTIEDASAERVVLRAVPPPPDFDFDSP